MLRIAVTMHQLRVHQAALEIAIEQAHKPNERAAFTIELERISSLVPKPKSR
jgi:hypothetical protein